MKNLLKGITAAMVILIVAVVFIFDVQFYIVKSGSMESTIHTGSVIVVTKQKEYQKNDIITFTKSSETVTHRLIDFSENGECITKGDANKAIDPTTTKLEMVKGKVLFSIPFLGYLIVFIQENLFIVFITIISAVVLINSLSNGKEGDKS